MKIINFKLRHKQSFNYKTVIDEDNLIFNFHSNTNSTGKTTLIRAFLYTLGFNVPDTELIKFSDFEFVMKIKVNNLDFDIIRKDSLITINDVDYGLPVDELAIRAMLFNITDHNLLDNLLGTIYFDQEKGWTLLNRGTIIGINRFSIEDFFRGLNDDDSEESRMLESKLREIDKKIAQYRLMVNIAEYQDAINIEVNKKVSYDTYGETQERELLEKRQRLSIVEEELKEINEIIKGNKDFVDYIEKKKIYIQTIDQEIIQVTRHNLYNYQQVFESNEARKFLLVFEKNSLKQRIAEIESMQRKQIVFDNIPNVEEELIKRLADVKRIGTIEAQSLVEQLKKERKNINEQLLKRTKFSNDWIDKAYKIIERYASELGLAPAYKIDIFTHKLKSKSGAILHKMVFMHKLVYIKLLSEKVGYPLPIFCDSPSGREIEDETIRTMLTIIKRDFAEHQVFIASINDYHEIFEDIKIIPMDGTLFNKQSLLD